MSSQVIATRSLHLDRDGCGSRAQCRGDWSLLAGVHHSDITSLDPGDTGHVITSLDSAPTRNSLDSVTPSHGGGGQQAHYEVRSSV